MATRDAPSALDERILDAARRCVLEYGVRKTTLVEVARRADVSRPTVYRRWADTPSLMADLITREFRATVADVLPEAADGRDARTRVVRGVVEGARRIRDHELFVKVFNADAELMLTYIVNRLGRSQRDVLELCAAMIRSGQEDGSVRAGDPERMATMLLL
ncbi:MAG: TetR/AcrR family transcriptional regulator, partial [Nocardioidaceae bacterium]